MAKPDLSHIPSAPGVYQMIDASGKIIYIGKSVNLKSRVRSYFVPNASLNFGKKKMVKQVVRVSYIETHSDLEALILETNMIKEHQPKYNVLMKDDKNLSYIKVTDSEVPMVTRTRKKTSDGLYFGPYSQYLNIGGTLHELKKIFCLGNHTKLKKGKQPPCMDYYIGICPGHCTGEKDKIDDYKKNLSRFIEFMHGDTGSVLEELTTKMQLHAKALQFEEAGVLKQKIQQLEQIHDRQIVRDAISGDHDVVVLLEKYEKCFVGVLEVRHGQIVAVYHHIIKNLGDASHDDIMQNVIMERYIDTTFQGSIFFDKEYQLDVVAEFLKSKKIQIKLPKRGEKVDILNFAKNDLLNFALAEQMKDISSRSLKKSDMSELIQVLFPNKGLVQSGSPLIFECFDISHHQGEHTVASKSVIENGKTQNAKYKKYNIKTLRSGMIDDFASMREVLARRTRNHFEGKDTFPHLIIIDGGKGQLSSAIQSIVNIAQAYGSDVIEENLEDLIPICSLAKREEEVFVPGKKDPILLEKGSPHLMLLQKARDEAHRFAINFNRQKRASSYTKTVLEEIPGIGPRTRQELLSRFGSLDGIESAPIAEVKKIVNAKQFLSLKEYGIVIE